MLCSVLVNIDQQKKGYGKILQSIWKYSILKFKFDWLFLSISDHFQVINKIFLQNLNHILCVSSLSFDRDLW